MDQLGFALERFDPIGRSRRETDGAAIDASAVMPDGTKFDGLPGLRTLLVDHREEFVATVTEKMLTYAMGRQVAYFDMPAVRKIQKEAAATNYRWSALILGIVKSAPFQRGPVEEAALCGVIAPLVAAVPSGAPEDRRLIDRSRLRTVRPSSRR
jgi:hypothetical protein